ncbi:protein gustavus-like [Homalodisca vitripennis]|uniref:protein gustavus-like n=1 Tax=Homalodisca vitripennis TaxID=197043 RepID=UPI001EEBF137|nr:protein gustavus-like [Homalodisca vitripennis]
MCRELSALIKTLQGTASSIILLTLLPIPKLEKKYGTSHFKLLEKYNSHIRSLENEDYVRIADICPLYLSSSPRQKCLMHLFEQHPPKSQQLFTEPTELAVSNQLMVYQSWFVHYIVRRQEFPFTCFRSTSTGAADAVRGRVGFSQGIHMWAIHWPAHIRGYHPMVGVASKDADLHGNGINSIVGSDDQSWGWNLSTLRLRHDCSMDSADYPVVAPFDDFEVPDSFGVVLDMYKGTLGFLIRVGDRRYYLGDAFTGLRGKVLFPIISTSSVPCQVTITYNGGLDSEPRSLMEICKKFIMQAVEDDDIDKIEELVLPQTVIKYLLDED